MFVSRATSIVVLATALVVAAGPAVGAPTCLLMKSLFGVGNCQCHAGHAPARDATGDATPAPAVPMCPHCRVPLKPVAPAPVDSPAPTEPPRMPPCCLQAGLLALSAAQHVPALTTPFAAVAHHASLDVAVALLCCADADGARAALVELRRPPDASFPAHVPLRS